MKLIKAGKFDHVAKSVSNKVADLLDCETITALISHAGETRVQMYLEAELIKLAANFNGNPALNLKDYQVPIIAEMLLQNYKWESVEDFTLCFRRASCGFYGEIYRIDGAVIGQWMARYLEEKYDALEQRKEKEKKDTPAVDLKKIADEQAAKYGKGTEYYQQAEKIVESMTAKKTVNDYSFENGYQRHKIFNPVKGSTEEEIEKKKLHIEYIRKNYDARTGQKLSTWLPEEEWIEKQK